MEFIRYLGRWSWMALIFIKEYSTTLVIITLVVMMLASLNRNLNAIEPDSLTNYLYLVLKTLFQGIVATIVLSVFTWYMLKFIFQLSLTLAQ